MIIDFRMNEYLGFKYPSTLHHLHTNQDKQHIHYIHLPSSTGTHVYWFIKYVLLPIVVEFSMAPRSQASIELLLIGGGGAHDALVLLLVLLMVLLVVVVVVVLLAADPSSFSVAEGPDSDPLQGSQVGQVLALQQREHLEALHGLVALHLEALGQSLLPFSRRLEASLQKVQAQCLFGHPLHPD